MSTFITKYLDHDLRLLKFNKPLHFFAEMPLYFEALTFILDIFFFKSKIRLMINDIL